MSTFSCRANRVSYTRTLLIVLCSVLQLPLMATAQLGGEPPSPAISVTEVKDGLTATIGDETLHLTVCNDSVIHVVSGPAVSPPPSSQPWMLPPEESCPRGRFVYTKDAENATLATSSLKVTFSLKRGNITYSTIKNEMLLRENGAVPRTYEAAVVNGENTYHVTDRFDPVATEAYYGLGQHQNGMFNYRGATVKLGQDNTDVAIPLLISSKGYALMWNTASLTEVDNRFPLALSLTSLAGQSIDYFMIYGPTMDNLIHEYRNMTGHSPMLPEWAFGFFQSKDRYQSQEEILEVARRYRQEHIPIDAIVQDWFWWKTEGDPEFNNKFTDVPAELKELHDDHLHAMISTWGLFDAKANNFKTLTAEHYDVHDAHVYDASNPKARDFYWKNLDGKLFAQGWDAFWLDSAEPEEYWPHMGDAILQNKHLYIGNGALYTNVFPLMHTLGVQEHWRATTSQKRVFLLTRSAFFGQQRVGATVWSGDVYSTYWGLSHQVTAGLNFALSGNPFWTTDIGGYWQPDDRAPDDPAYQELYTRWFEFGAFCPIFRSHGHRAHNEMWTYDKAEPTLLKYDKLRYRLMPYIYSLAWRVHSGDYTVQRPLVMDWQKDPRTWNIGDEFMFGSALLVNPVVKQDAVDRSVYLPASPVWYDFWTGESMKGEQDIQAAAPLDRIPLFVPAGSILPLGPEIEYANQMPAGPIELRVYTGSDGKFDIYEDEGDNYNYEKGSHALIPVRWSDSDKTLSFGDRVGSYAGMPEEMTFNVVWVSSNHGVGEAVNTTPDRVVKYYGKQLSVQKP